MNEHRTRVAIVTNSPAPYRLPVYASFAAEPDIALRLFYCTGREPDRAWDVDPSCVPHEILRERTIRWQGRFIHLNPDVWRHLRAFGPDVVVTTGFNPTHLLAFTFAQAHAIPHVAWTDGTALSESRLSALHRWLRRRVYRHSRAFIGAGEGSFALYRQYGIADSALFRSRLCVDNLAFAAAAQGPRDVDLLFCGRFVAGKRPLFALEVAAATARRLGRRVGLLFVGSGELEGRMRHAAAAVSDRVAAEFAGFARQAELPRHCARARVLLFPTAGDAWGVVANEACAAGLAVIVSPQAGVAGELVRDGENGRVLALDVARWAEAAADLLGDAETWSRASVLSAERVRPYTHASAAQGLAEAVRHALRGDVGVQRLGQARR